MALKVKVIMDTTSKEFEKRLEEYLPSVGVGSVQYRYDGGMHSALVISETSNDVVEDKA